MFVSTSNFDDIDASVYCISAGWAGGKMAINSANLQGQIHVSDLECSGNESSILECPGNWDPELASRGYGFKSVANCRPQIYMTGSGQTFYGAVVLTTRDGTGLLSGKNFDETEARKVS